MPEFGDVLAPAPTPQPNTATGFSVRRTLLLLSRAVRLRCPRCGVGTMIAKWLRPALRCPHCGQTLDRGEHDYFLGSMMFNLVIAEGVFTVTILLAVLLTWPDPPWALLTYGGAVLMFTLPFVFFPFSKMIWLAFDLAFRPELDGDYELF